jgi:hypothetical protein
MPYIKLIMEVNSCLLELLLHLHMQLQGPFDYVVLLFFDALLEIEEMTIEDRVIDDG